VCLENPNYWVVTKPFALWQVQENQSNEHSSVHARIFSRSETLCTMGGCPEDHGRFSKKWRNFLATEAVSFGSKSGLFPVPTSERCPFGRAPAQVGAEAEFDRPCLCTRTAVCQTSSDLMRHRVPYLLYEERKGVAVLLQNKPRTSYELCSTTNN